MQRKRHVLSLLAILVSLLLGHALHGEGPETEEERIPIGSRVDSLRFKDIRYLERTLDEFGKKKAYVLVFMTSSCPIAGRYLPKLERLHKAYSPKGVQFLAVNVAPNESILEMATQAVEHEMTFPFVKDMTGKVARRVGAERTPEAVVLDDEMRIRYRGRIDDQIRFGGVRPKMTRDDLKEALEDLLAGDEVRVPETPVDGCRITFDSTPTREKVVFTRDVAPIIKKHCVECHRPGTEAPFTLTSYDDVSGLGEMVAEVVRERRMPPWYASPEYGHFRNARTLSTEEIETIQNWVASGMPRGKGSGTIPLSKEAKTGGEWTIGKPDKVLTVPQPIEIQADGYMPYQYALIPHVFEHDTWVQRVEIKPTTPEVLHHANLGYILTDDPKQRSHFITGKVPGGGAMKLKEGVGFMIPKGAVLGLQIHYTPIGVKVEDQISVGLVFPKEPIRKRIRHLVLENKSFEIPAGDRSHEVRASKVLRRDALGLGLFSHMHLRGRDMTFYATYPDGRRETLLMIPNYSFDWQLAYVWPRGKKRFPKGTRFECVAHFDNSAFNPYNPDASKKVEFGLQTYHEMMYGFIFYVDESEDLNLRVDPETGRPLPNERRSF